MSIATEISRLTSAKASIKSAIEAKGVTVPSSTTLDGYATLIASIPSGGSNFDAWLKNGDTHLWIEILNPAQCAQQIRIRMIGTIDWGDGSSAQSVSVTTYTTFTHTYSQPGKYRIDLHPTSGTFYLGGASSSYCVMGTRSSATYFRVSSLYQVEIGTSRITTISNYAFYYCCGLLRVYIPKTVTTIGTYAFYDCFSLTNVECADSSTITTTNLSNVFYNCYCLQDVSTFNPPAVTTLTTTFRYCYSLCEYTIAATVTSIAANTFSNAYSIQKLKCLPTSPPTVANANALTGINSSCVIEVPRNSLNSYQTANIWSTYASQMVGV